MPDNNKIANLNNGIGDLYKTSDGKSVFVDPKTNSVYVLGKKKESANQVNSTPANPPTVSSIVVPDSEEMEALMQFLASLFEKGGATSAVMYSPYAQTPYSTPGFGQIPYGAQHQIVQQPGQAASGINPGMALIPYNGNMGPLNKFQNQPAPSQPSNPFLSGFSIAGESGLLGSSGLPNPEPNNPVYYILVKSNANPICVSPAKIDSYVQEQSGETYEYSNRVKYPILHGQYEWLQKHNAKTCQIKAWQDKECPLYAALGCQTHGVVCRPLYSINAKDNVFVDQELEVVSAEDSILTEEREV